MKCASLTAALAVLVLSGCMSPMNRASRNGDTKTLQRLLDEGHHVDETQMGGESGGTFPRSPLQIAANSGSLESARFLIQKGADPNFADPKYGTTPLMDAAFHGNLAMAKLLVEAGANPGAKDVDGDTALDKARKYGGFAMVQYLGGLAARSPAPSAVAAAAPETVAAPVIDDLAPKFSAAPRLDDLAVVVGVETYSDIAAKAPYAERDADAFKAYVRALGVPERNIVLLKGSKAGKAALEKNIEQWLPRMSKPDGRVYFYFSGHGAPDVRTGRAYLVPWDGDPNYLETTSYPVAKLFQKLGELPSKQVLVALDSCFSGAGGRSVLASGARPLVSKVDTGDVPSKLTVLSASAGNEISGSLDDKGHGAFTYFLLKGLNAGKTTPSALVEYLTPRVQDEARRLNRDQTPQLRGDGSWSLR